MAKWNIQHGIYLQHNQLDQIIRWCANNIQQKKSYTQADLPEEAKKYSYKVLIDLE